MSRERAGFRENLRDILEFSEMRRMLTLSDVSRYTGIADSRTLKKLFPFTRGKYISAATLAYHLAGGADE